MVLERFYDYVLHIRLNEGGMAEVFLATDAHDRTVAVRRLRPEFKFRLSKRTDFRRGMEIQQRMRGPHVVHVLELRTKTLIPYAVMEYIEGVNLRQAFHRRREFFTEWTRAYLIFERIAKGLGEIHRHGFMHLDFKPENMMINHTGDVRIMDFDLARPIPKKTEELGTAAGTPSYLAPEVLLRQPVDQRADIFALGITGYELFAGRKPVVAEAPQDLVCAYTSAYANFPSPASINPALPRSISELLMNCVEKKMDARYPSIPMILRDLLKIRVPPGTRDWSPHDDGGHA